MMCVVYNVVYWVLSAISINKLEKVLKALEIFPLLIYSIKTNNLTKKTRLNKNEHEFAIAVTHNM